MPNYITSGKTGENLAVLYLIEKQYEILETNWRYKHLEIDIIALKNNILSIIEVKLRSSDSFGEPQTFVTLKKQKNLIQATNAYVQTKHLNYEVRFDVIAIIKTKLTTKINFIKDAFYPY